MSGNHLEPVSGAQISPFDGIKHSTPEGGDYWSARELMPLMGYTAWRNFEVPLKRAMKSAEVQGIDVTSNFAGSRKITATKPQDDYHLTRFAAYLVAMNGDPNKAEVAAAQSYFAVRTREAETRPQVPAIPQTYAEALRAAADAAERAELEAKRAEHAELEAKRSERRLETQAPQVAKARAHSAVKEWKRRQDFYREIQQWGDSVGAYIKQQDVSRLLVRKGMLIGPGRSDSGQIKRQHVSAGHGQNKKGVAENGYAYVTPTLSSKGQDLVWKWVLAAHEEFGDSLNPKMEDEQNA